MPAHEAFRSRVLIRVMNFSLPRLVQKPDSTTHVAPHGVKTVKLLKLWLPKTVASQSFWRGLV